MAGPDLDFAEIDRQLALLDRWEHRDGALFCVWEFADFSAAFAFMREVAVVAEQLGHHPDWSNSYARVEIALRTHDAGRVTQLDFDLARAITAVARRQTGA